LFALEPTKDRHNVVGGPIGLAAVMSTNKRKGKLIALRVTIPVV